MNRKKINGVKWSKKDFSLLIVHIHFRAAYVSCSQVDYSVLLNCLVLYVVSDWLYSISRVLTCLFRWCSNAHLLSCTVTWFQWCFTGLSSRLCTLTPSIQWYLLGLFVYVVSYKISKVFNMTSLPPTISYLHELSSVMKSEKTCLSQIGPQIISPICPVV